MVSILFVPTKETSGVKAVHVKVVIIQYKEK